MTGRQGTPNRPTSSRNCSLTCDVVAVVATKRVITAYSDSRMADSHFARVNHFPCGIEVVPLVHCAQVAFGSVPRP